MTTRAASPPLAGVRGVTYDLWRTLVRDRDTRQTEQLRLARLRDLLGADEDEVRRLLDDVRAFRHAEWTEQRAPTPAAMVEHALRRVGEPRTSELVDRIVDCMAGPPAMRASRCCRGRSRPWRRSGRPAYPSR